MTVTIGRRELLAALGGAVATWPLAACAQPVPSPVVAARHAVPAIYQDRLHAEVGGLISYGASLTDA